MAMVTLGKTGITVEKNAFGALPIQRISTEEAVHLLRKAYKNGMRFFDTARMYTDSEEKVGIALEDVRSEVVIATKTTATTVEGFKKDLEESLKKLRTSYIDIYQFHNPSFCPKPNDGTGLYEEMLKAQEEGKIKFIGISNHRIKVAQEAIDSGLYDTLQYPFSYLTGEQELSFVQQCKEKDIGFICMKAMSGGLIQNGKAAAAFMNEHENVLPIWGVQKEHELDEFLSYINNPPSLDDSLNAIIAKDREELVGGFCRGCGYCMPCPVNINISLAARMSLMLRRAPVGEYTTPSIIENMHQIPKCIQCNSCKKKCPYGLDIPNLLKENYEDFLTFI